MANYRHGQEEETTQEAEAGTEGRPEEADPRNTEGRIASSDRSHHP